MLNFTNVRVAMRRGLPVVVVDMIRSMRRRYSDWRFAGLSSAEVFSRIYSERLWASDGAQAFSSGTGSHDPAVVAPYLRAVKAFLLAHPRKKAVDLGCGDFNVGSQLVAEFDSYIACDVVPELVAYNAGRFVSAGLEFRLVDMIEDPLPPGEICFVRQVLQHLTNVQIGRVVPKLAAYDALVISEHVPAGDEFPPNLDKPQGPGIRLERGSGVDIRRSPFSLSGFKAEVICEVESEGGVIRTTAYWRE
jgi:hypothetical protein